MDLHNQMISPNNSSPMNLSPSSSTSSNSEIWVSCNIHPNEAVTIFCDNCSAILCPNCDRELHSNHHIYNIGDLADSSFCKCVTLFVDFHWKAMAAKEGMEKIQKMTIDVNDQANSVATEIETSFNIITNIFESRKQTLLNHVEKLRSEKIQHLLVQSNNLRKFHDSFIKSANQLDEVVTSGVKAHMLLMFIEAMKDLKNIPRSIFCPDNPEYYLHYFVPEIGVFHRIAACCIINSPSFGKFDIFEKAARTRFSNKLANNNMILSKEQEAISKILGSAVSLDVLSDKDTNHHKLSVLLNIGHDNEHQDRNDDSFLARRQITPDLAPAYISLMRNQENAILAFGEEGGGDGQFCRPWGVCCDQYDNIIVADRSNNRIQVFRSDGSLLRKFGTLGSAPGQLDRPAGVATDQSGNIVVADKDNHRIQIFTKLGEFLFTFGEKGTDNGQFNYPWDVDINSNGLILVSDTRNHRIQLFQPNGKFISKYGFENSSMWKNIDSPRGVCFISESSVAITDFNNHRVVIVKYSSRNNKFFIPMINPGRNLTHYYLGSEGNGTDKFFRPQGITKNSEGHLIVADSRNNRIQVLDQSGYFLKQLGKAGQEIGHLDRPSGVCVTSDGKIVVVDFGNNRIQIFSSSGN